MGKKVVLIIAIIAVFISSECCFSAPANKPVAKKPVVKKTTDNKSAGKKTADKKPAGKKNSDKAVVADGDQVSEVSKVNYKSRREIKYTGFDTKRDPFCPPVEIGKMLEKTDKIIGDESALKDVKLPKVDLQGIIWSKKTPQVIINGGVMSVGEFIDEFEIKEIQRTGIILFYKGNNYFIKMLGYERPNKQKKKR